MRNETLEKKFAKAVYKYSLGKISIDEADSMSDLYVKQFLKNCETSPTLGHKGIDWYAREIVKGLK